MILKIKYIKKSNIEQEGIFSSPGFIKIAPIYLRLKAFPIRSFLYFSPSHWVKEITWTAILQVHIFEAVSLYRTFSVGLTFEENVPIPVADMVFCLGSRLQAKALSWTVCPLILFHDPFYITLTKHIEVHVKTTTFFSTFSLSPFISDVPYASFNLFIGSLCILDFFLFYL